MQVWRKVRQNVTIAGFLTFTGIFSIKKKGNLGQKCVKRGLYHSGVKLEELP